MYLKTGKTEHEKLKKGRPKLCVHKPYKNKKLQNQKVLD